MQINKPLHAPVHSISQYLGDQIQVQKPVQVIATDQVLNTLWVESSIISIYTNIR